MRVSRLLFGFLLVAGAALAAPAPAAAHALVGRQDLPIPEWLFAWGASLVLLVSFVALTLAWRSPRLQADGWRPAARSLSRTVVNRGTETAAGLIGVALLALTVWSGLEGTAAPDRNFSLTFVFVTVWLGFVLLSVLFGDVFKAFNPWRALGRAAGGAFRLVAGQPAPRLAYPERLGRWPAVAGLLGFLWLELVYGQSGFQTAGLEPRVVAIATLLYSLVTFAGMAAFGVEQWTRRGETFSVYFEMFSRISAIEVRDRRLGFRHPLSGLATWATVPGTAALVLLTIGATTFDGAQEGALNGAIESVYEALLDGGLAPKAALRTASTAFLMGVVLAVGAIFWLGIRGMRTVAGSPPFRRLGEAFVHAFVPIALAYLVAHYFSLFLFQEQAQFTYLMSDPLGEGSDYFGTADSGIDYGVIGATAIWYVQVAALVVGHVLALVLGHDRALATYGDPETAARSQYWMLALMISFTSLGLFLLSQANA